MLTISVSDTGCGISEEDQKRLFQEFSCLKSNMKMNPNGVGLGLFISMKLVSNLFGDIWVESVLGEGTTFSFKIPIGYKIEDEDKDLQEEEKENKLLELVPAKEASSFKQHCSNDNLLVGENPGDESVDLMDISLVSQRNWYCEQNLDNSY